MSFDPEKLLIFNELSEIIRWHNQCIDRLGTYKKNHPYLIAPNLHKMMEENLKENVQMLYKELNNLNKPKTEQRRHVCRECHSVFAAALPGGICDECRSKVGATNRYDTPPPSEIDTVSDIDDEQQGESIDTVEVAAVAADVVEQSEETENAAEPAPIEEAEVQEAEPQPDPEPEPASEPVAELPDTADQKIASA